MTKKVFFLNLLIIFFFTSTINSQEDQICDIILQKYRKINTIKTSFDQILKSKTTKQEEQRKGIIICKKTKHALKVRWEIQSPEKEVLIVNGDTIWDYFPENEIAYKYKLSKIEQSRIIFDLISGRLNIKEKFTIEPDRDKKDKNLQKYKLIPNKPEPNMVLVYLWIDNDYWIRKINIIDFFGNENIISFNDIKTNISLQEKDPFWETVPQHIQIVEGSPQQ